MQQTPLAVIPAVITASGVCCAERKRILLSVIPAVMTEQCSSAHSDRDHCSLRP